MSQPTLKALSKPEENPIDPLTEILRQGARDLISQAVEAELEACLKNIPATA